MMLKRQGRKTLATEARHYIQIQTAARVSDGEGGFNATWTTGDTIPAGVSPIRAVQQYQNQSVDVDATHLISIRGQIELNEKDRFLWGSRVFEILTIENIQERGVLKVCTCKERRYDGQA